MHTIVQNKPSVKYLAYAGRFSCSYICITEGTLHLQLWTLSECFTLSCVRWEFASQITVSLSALVYLKCSLHLILEGLNRLENWPEGEHHHREEQFVLQLLRSQPNNSRSNRSARSHQQYQSRDTVFFLNYLFVEGSHHGRWNFKDTNP